MAKRLPVVWTAGAVFLGACASPKLASDVNRRWIPPTCVCDRDLLDPNHDRVFFDFGSSTLSVGARTILVRQAAWLAKYPNVNVLVAGNADDRGAESYNLALGLRRADSVREYLVAQGVVASRLRTISYGKDCPVAAGSDDASYQQNRNAITSLQGFNPQSCH